MNYRYICLFCLCLTLFSGCFLKKKGLNLDGINLPQWGVTVKLPENFHPVPPERLKDMETLPATIIKAEPFTVIPRYAYAESSGKGFIVISELKFNEGVTAEKYPLNSIFMYQKNLEKYFDTGEISSEEIDGKDISTILMAMMFEEESEDIALFKGLSYVYPDRFFMIDLYVIRGKAVIDDASGYINLFYSMEIY